MVDSPSLKSGPSAIAGDWEFLEMTVRWEKLFFSMRLICRYLWDWADLDRFDVGVRYCSKGT